MYHYWGAKVEGNPLATTELDFDTKRNETWLIEIEFKKQKPVRESGKANVGHSYGIERIEKFSIETNQ